MTNMENRLSIEDIYKTYYELFISLPNKSYFSDSDWTFYFSCFLMLFSTTLVESLTNDKSVAIYSLIIQIIVFIVTTIWNKKKKIISRENNFKTFYNKTRILENDNLYYSKNFKNLKILSEAKTISIGEFHNLKLPIFELLTIIVSIPGFFSFFIENENKKSFSDAKKAILYFFDTKYLFIVSFLLLIILFFLFLEYRKRNQTREKIFIDCIMYINKLLEIER